VIRFTIIRTLLLKEFHRHLANRGGLALALLLVTAAVLLSVFNPTAGSNGDGGGTGMVGGVHTCIIEYVGETDLVRHLKAADTAGLKIIFFDRSHNRPDELISYQPGTGAIHLRTFRPSPSDRERLTVQFWHPKGDAVAMAPYEQWFYRETHRFFERKLGVKDSATDTATSDDLWPVREAFGNLERIAAPGVMPAIAFERQGLAGKVLDLRSAIATGMVVFALYFACVYLLPTLNCEERERGVLLAQALSPASPIEILAAKFLFYPVLGIGLAAIIAGIYRPELLSSLFFWMALVAVAAGYLGIGMTIATLARTQRAAFLGAMCYLLSVMLILFICNTNNIPLVSYLAVEFHGPRILHAALSNEVLAQHWLHLAAAGALAVVWMVAAAWLFRRRGWQ
jgi:hypothetical protein